MRKEGGKGGGEEKGGRGQGGGQKNVFCPLTDKIFGPQCNSICAYFVYLLKWKEQIRHVHWANDSLPFPLVQREESGGRGWEGGRGGGGRGRGGRGGGGRAG
jgi:hypothetical protein